MKTCFFKCNLHDLVSVAIIPQYLFLIMPIQLPLLGNILLKFVFFSAMIVILIVFGVSLIKGDPSVHLLSENFNQVITSTTLKWVPASRNGKIDFENAVIGAEQIIEGKFLTITV